MPIGLPTGSLRQRDGIVNRVRTGMASGFRPNFTHDHLAIPNVFVIDKGIIKRMRKINGKTFRPRRKLVFVYAEITVNRKFCGNTLAKPNLVKAGASDFSAFHEMLPAVRLPNKWPDQ